MVMCVQMLLKSRQLPSVTWHVLQNLRQYERKLPSGNIYKIRNFCSAASEVSVQRRFTDKHEWILCEGSIGTVGVTHHAQDSLGEVVYAQLPDIGTSIGKEEECGALESVKAASEIYCPVSGKVVEKNEEVESIPSLINKSCYEKGWLFKLELANPDELSKLMSEEEYEKFIKSERR